MYAVLIVLVQAATAVMGVFGWIAMVFASLPGSSLSMSWHARCVRGLFYIYPAFVLLALYGLNRHAPISGWGFLWSLLPLLPVALVWLIFKIYEWMNQR